MRWISLSLSVLLSFSSAGARPQPLRDYLKKPKLIVVVVFDQFRSDYLTRLAPRFGRGGFMRLLNGGAYYPFAKYDLLQSMTCPGHASISTGAYPYRMGIPLNTWYDRREGRPVYCAEDLENPIVGLPTGVATPGISPKRLVGSTIGDELKNAGYPSRVVAVALKDRAAVMLGGHRADLALWFEEHRWVSSKYYVGESLPRWVDTLNAKNKEKYSQKSDFRFVGPTTGLFEPISLPAANFEGVALNSEKDITGPLGVRLTTEMAIEALNTLKLGSGPATDILFVSYSSHDMLGHMKGPNAGEMEEMTLFEDQSLADLFNAIDARVGLKNTIIALTGDHGVAPAPEWAKAHKMPAGVISSKQLEKDLNTALNEKWGEIKGEPWILSARGLNVYINPKALAAKKKASGEVELSVKEALRGREGIAEVITATDIAQGFSLPAGLGRQVKNTFISGKNGDVLIVPKPFWIDDGNFATHLTSYAYDQSVPLVLLGRPFRAGVYSEPAQVVDLAPTLSFVLGILPPSGSEGRVLTEAF